MENFPLCKLYLLKYGFEKSPIPRESIVRSFGAHNKHLDPGSLSKLDDSLNFWAWIAKDRNV